MNIIEEVLIKISHGHQITKDPPNL